MTTTASKPMLWIGRVLSALPVLLIAFGFISLAMDPEGAKVQTDKFAYPESVMQKLMIVEIACLVLYLIPQTAMLGAILMTGYFGGAIATHVRVQDNGWILPLILGVIIWLGLWFRDPRLRALVPIRWL